ncbi:MAG: hypothetical protein AAGF12_34370 [Myxococcota bacterium]
MRLVVLESPYAGDVAKNVAYARMCVLDCLRRGEAPIASHLLFPAILGDCEPQRRRLGIAAGLAWVKVAHAQVFYQDLGVSPGMRAAMVEPHGGARIERRLLEECAPDLWKRFCDEHSARK